MDTPSIVLVQRFTYKGKTEEYSNKYHFTGTTPADAAAWATLAAAIADALKVCLPVAVTIVRAFGYEAGNENAVAVVDFATITGGVRTGTIPLGTSWAVTPGDETAMVRWKTAETTTNNKPIYLRKYIHPAIVDQNTETINTQQRTPLLAFAAKMYDGTLPGGVKYCGPQGAVPISHTVNTYATVRQLKRRGEAPSYAVNRGKYLRASIGLTGRFVPIGVYDQPSDEEGIYNLYLPTYEEARFMPFAEEYDALVQASYWFSKRADQTASLMERLINAGEG